MGWLKSLFGGNESSSRQAEKAVDFRGLRIKPEPRKQGDGFVTAGYICTENSDGEWEEEYFIRADTHTDFESASEHAVFKGKQIINERLGPDPDET